MAVSCRSIQCFSFEAKMNRRRFLGNSLVALCACPLLAHHHVIEAANILNYVESTRREAVVVYVGSVASVRILARSSLGLQASAHIRLLAVARGQGPASGTATIRYSSYDEKTPPNDGGLQYKIDGGDTVLVFADSFAQGSPSSLIRGTRAEIVSRIESLAANVERMSDDDLAFEGITQKDRADQLALYSFLLTSLRVAD
jgi:hypothetical protein